MRIGIVGGLDRNESVYYRLAEKVGHEVEFHPGHIGGRLNASLAALIDRVDLVIVVTDLNSHGAVLLARKLVRARGVPLLLLRRCGISRFTELLESLNRDGASALAVAQRS
jgi:hypothetical protein